MFFMSPHCPLPITISVLFRFCCNLAVLWTYCNVSFTIKQAGRSTPSNWKKILIFLTYQSWEHNTLSTYCPAIHSALELKTLHWWPKNWIFCRWLPNFQQLCHRLPRPLLKIFFSKYCLEAVRYQWSS